MLPRISNSYANGEKQRVAVYMKKSFRMVFLLSFPMIFGILSVSTRFVPLFFGQGYDRVIILMNAISPIILAIGISNVTGTQYLLPTKRQREFSISVIKSGKNYLFASIIMFIGCLLIGKFLDTSLISLFVIVVLGVALYGISLIILKDDFIFEVLNKVKNKIKQN